MAREQFRPTAVCSQTINTRLVLALKTALDKCKTLVMASVLDGEFPSQKMPYQNLIGSDSVFLSNAKTGFINVILENDEVSTLKRFSVQEEVRNKVEYHFSIRTAMSFDSLRTMHFIQMHPKILDVNFYGDIDSYVFFSAKSILDGELKREDIEGKIVILGSFSVFDKDIFFTPLKKKKNSANPGMFGVVYLANVVNQVLTE